MRGRTRAWARYRLESWARLMGISWRIRWRMAHQSLTRRRSTPSVEAPHAGK